MKTAVVFLIAAPDTAHSTASGCSMKQVRHVCIVWNRGRKQQAAVTHALEGQDLPRTYLAQDELESVNVLIFIIVIQARVALRLPWWSLSTGFAAVRQMAGLQGDASAVQRALKEQTYAANGALPPGAMPAKDDRQVGHIRNMHEEHGQIACPKLSMSCGLRLEMSLRFVSCVSELSCSSKMC